MTRALSSFLAREWPLVAAALALLSLAFLPRFIRAQGRAEERSRAFLDEARRQIDAEPERIGPRLRLFLSRQGEGPQASEARYLLARSIVRRAEGGEFPGLPSLDEAWQALSKARGAGFDLARCAALQRDVVLLLDERNYMREAVERARELVRDGGVPEARLDLARALAGRAPSEPDARASLLAEADGLVSEVLRSESGNRIDGFLAQVDVFTRAGQFAEALAWIGRAMESAPRAEDRARLLLERAKALGRLGRSDDARSAAMEAETRSATPAIRDRAILVRAIVGERTRRGDSRREAERLIRTKSPVAPVARLVLGLCDLDAHDPASDPVASLASGLGALRRPGLLEETGFDTGDLQARIRLRCEASRDPQDLTRIAGLYADLSRLFPASADIAFDHARLWEKLGESAKAADRLTAAANELSDPAARERALRGAAEACLSGALYLRAAPLYRQVYELRPRENLDALYSQAEALRLAGCYRSSSPNEPDALSIYAEVVSHAPPGDPRVPQAILRRGLILAKLGSRDEAVREFDRILGGELGVGPDSGDWAEALLGRGRALGEKGRADLRNYLDRYSRRFDFRPGVREAGLLLARAAVREGDWPSALDALARVDALPDLAPEVRQEVRSLKGDVLLGQGRWDEAAAAYDQGYRADLSSDERLWCLLGRARASLRLGRKDDARRDYENGRALYEDRRESFERSLARHGKDVWTPALESLGRELQ